MFTNLSELVTFYRNDSSELRTRLGAAPIKARDFLPPLVGLTDHKSAPWFLGNKCTREDIRLKLANTPNGTFYVHGSDNNFQISYAWNHTIVEEPIEINANGCKFAHDSQYFFSVSALIADHFYNKGILKCMLLCPPGHNLRRALTLTGTGREYTTARSRVDESAAKSLYYLGGVPEEYSLDVLEGAFDGAFTVRDSLIDDQVLWLNYVSEGQLLRSKIENSSRGLHLEGSDKFFMTLSELITTYCGDNSELPYGLRMGWGTSAPVPAPPIGFYDHLTAPWYHGNITRDEATARLEGQPAGSFVRLRISNVWCHYTHGSL